METSQLFPHRGDLFFLKRLDVSHCCKYEQDGGMLLRAAELKSKVHDEKAFERSLTDTLMHVLKVVEKTLQLHSGL